MPVVPVTAVARDLRVLPARALRSDVLRKGNIYVLSSALSQGVMLVAWMLLPRKLPPQRSASSPSRTSGRTC